MTIRYLPDIVNHTLAYADTVGGAATAVTLRKRSKEANQRASKGRRYRNNMLNFSAIAKEVVAHKNLQRAQMIARGLTRGLTYPDIEKTCTREPDWYLVRRYLHRYINSQGFVNYLNDDELKGKETLCVLYHQWRTSTELQRKKMPHNEYPFLRT